MAPTNIAKLSGNSTENPFPIREKLMQLKLKKKQNVSFKMTLSVNNLS
jgi:hypothetical protein